MRPSNIASRWAVASCRSAVWCAAFLAGHAHAQTLVGSTEAFADWQDVARAGGAQVDAMSLAPQDDGKLIYRARRGPGYLHVPRWVVADCAQRTRGERPATFGIDASAKPTPRMIETTALQPVAPTDLDAAELDWACARAGLATDRPREATAATPRPAVPGPLASITEQLRQDLAESRQILGQDESAAPKPSVPPRSSLFAADERTRRALTDFLVWVGQRRQQVEQVLAPFEAKLGKKTLDDCLTNELMMSSRGRETAYQWIADYGAMAEVGAREAELMVADMRAELSRRVTNDITDPAIAQRVTARVEADFSGRAAFITRFWAAGKTVAQAGREYVDFFEHYRGDVELVGGRFVMDTDANLEAYRAVAGRLDRAQAELRTALTEVARRQSDALATIESLSPQR